MHLPRLVLESSLAPKSYCQDGSTHTDQWIPIPKFVSVRPRFIQETAELQTDTRTHTPDQFYYLDRVADVGGKNKQNSSFT